MSRDDILNREAMVNGIHIHCKIAGGGSPELSECTKETVKPMVEIAYHLITQNGLEGLRIRQVAAEAGIDNGTLHYHFPSKDALIPGVVDYLT